MVNMWRGAVHDLKGPGLINPPGLERNQADRPQSAFLERVVNTLPEFLTRLEMRNMFAWQ